MYSPYYISRYSPPTTPLAHSLAHHPSPTRVSCAHTLSDIQALLLSCGTAPSAITYWRKTTKSLLDVPDVSNFTTMKSTTRDEIRCYV